jgi:hypothetical protein
MTPAVATASTPEIMTNLSAALLTDSGSCGSLK